MLIIMQHGLYRSLTVAVTAGTYECPSSAWIVEYAGYIMSNRHDRYKGEFVCMDQNPEKGPGNVNHNNAPWYPTEIECGTLPCPPYTHDREV